jgi:hypothetical protein
MCIANARTGGPIFVRIIFLFGSSFWVALQPLRNELMSEALPRAGHKMAQ